MKCLQKAISDYKYEFGQLVISCLQSLQEVSKQADHAPTKTFYLFNVNLPAVYELLSGDMSKSLYNLLVCLISAPIIYLLLINSQARLRSEIDKHRDVCYRAETYGEETLSEADRYVIRFISRINN